MKILFRTIAGSRLYGLAHENSDYDYYTVVERVEKKKATYHSQSIFDGVDTTVVDFGTWVNDCQAGVPQALEAMFSQKADFDQLSFFRSQFHASSNNNTYLRIIKRLALTPKWDDFKHKRHMIRLAMNFSSMRETGRFNPTLSGTGIAVANIGGNLSQEKAYELALAIAWS